MAVSLKGAPSFATIIEFGDSLSDSGGAFGFTGGMLPPPNLIAIDPVTGLPTGVDLSARGIFYDQVFTNGPVFPDVTASVLGNQDNDLSFLDVDSDGAPGNNFAVGGATVVAENADIEGNTLNAQLTAFETALATSAISPEVLERSAASIFIGLNDLAAIASRLADTAADDLSAETVIADLAAVTDGIEDAAERLVDAGVPTIILNTLPGAAFFPGGGGLSEIEILGATIVTGAINARIHAAADNLAASGAHVEVVAFDQLAEEIADDPDTFGFLSLENVISGSGTSPLVSLNPEAAPIDKAGFLDTVHFSAEMHEVFGVFQAKTLGNETIDGSFLPNVIHGGAGAQTIFAQGGSDHIRAGRGEDLVFAGRGSDVAYAGRGDDIAFGGSGRDLLFGGDGGDILAGGRDHDRIYGGDGADILAGNAGDDRLIGGDGGDVLLDGLGDDRAFGGAGDDTFLWVDNEILGGGVGEDLLSGGAGSDTLVVVTHQALDATDDAEIAAFLSANGVEVRDVETFQFVSEAELSDIAFADVSSEIVRDAELFGLL